MTLSINSQNPVRMPVSPLQILLLLQLDEGSKYGYEMLVTLKEEFEGIWEPKTGTVYPALKSLEKKGFIETETRDETEYYKITEQGRQLFEIMLYHIEGSIDFSIKYISVVFKWLTYERKQGAIELIDKLTSKEQAMTNQLLGAFADEIDTDIKERILTQIKKNTENRLDLINKILEKKE
jgi:DNA-binding PadR family transcriptional regulator